jgi:predicted DsbA family dithiol-disulfide isomerase
MIQIEIWSDVVCPFCYIGKRRLEKALTQFAHADEVSITWRSFLLDAQTKTEPGKSINQHLAEKKGWTLEQTRDINAYVRDMAAGEGLDYNFDTVVVANSVHAHRLLQLGKRYRLGDAVKEALMKGYFIEGKNIDDLTTLQQIGVDAGLPADSVSDLLADEQQFRRQVFEDASEAAALGARGVPFFVFDRKYAISGAQPVEAFLQVLDKAYADAPQIVTGEGDTCTTEGEC